MKKTKNLEDLGDLLKEEKKPKEENKKTIATTAQVARSGVKTIYKGLKLFR